MDTTEDGVDERERMSTVAEAFRKHFHSASIRRLPPMSMNEFPDAEAYERFLDKRCKPSYRTVTRAPLPSTLTPLTLAPKTRRNRAVVDVDSSPSTDDDTLPSWITWAVGAAGLAVALTMLGRKPDPPSTPTTVPAGPAEDSEDSDEEDKDK